jgi:hypothetical protein
VYVYVVPRNIIEDLVERLQLAVITVDTTC